MPAPATSSRFLHALRVIAIGRRPRRTLLRLVVLGLLAFVIFKFVFVPVRVTGGSMEPTYHNGGVNFINRLAYLRHGPRRGDVVGIRLSTDPSAGLGVMLLKRVVGLPGETISFARGRVCVNGVPQPEAYLKFPSHWEGGQKILGPNDYYVVGDNRTMPPEDHTHGVAERGRIVGKVLLPGNRSQPVATR